MLTLFPLLSARAAEPDLWTLANNKAASHRFSTLFTAQNVRDNLATAEGRAAAVDWCRRTGITKVYLETYRDQYQAERANLERARDYFRREGFLVSGCVTTTQIGKVSNGWNVISCYTNPETQKALRAIFEYTAAIFDEIMVDDFWFTDCTCQECDTARKAGKVRIGDQEYPTLSDSWEHYRAELMARLSRTHLLAAAKKVNPNARLIIKYPQWYDRFQERGYDVIRQTRYFDRIWVGTETRDRDKRSGRMQYEAYFLMRWLAGIGGKKTGGGWFDPLETTEKTYVEQARQTILAGARESMLFSYGALQNNFGPANIAALRRHIPELLEVATQVRRRQPIGVAAYKPAGSHPDDELNIYDFVGMLGIPLAPCHEFPSDAPALFLPIHAWTDATLAGKLEAFIQTGKPVLVSDGLSRRLTGKVSLSPPNVRVLKAAGRPESLLQMPPKAVEDLRNWLLQPFGVEFKAPPDVGLYLFSDGSWVIENFRNEPMQVKLNRSPLIVGPREWMYQWK